MTGSSADNNNNAQTVAARLAGAAAPLTLGDSRVTGAFFVDQGSFDEAELRPHVSIAERGTALTIASAEVRRQFLLRRCFQRGFVKTVLGWDGDLASVPMRHDAEQRPYCFAAPDIWFSFSSSGAIAIACAARVGQAGTDIEKLRPVAEIRQLSARFLCSGEAAHLARLPDDVRQATFFRYWTIKEACLKAVGHGLSYGLDQFSIAPDDGYHIDPPPEFGDRQHWRIESLTVPEGYVATVAHFRPSVT
jgi:4'-phosphopantetheinyl transferase